MSSASTRRSTDLVQLARGSHLAHSFDRGVNSHLSTLNGILLRICVLLGSLLDIRIPPLKRISHVHILLGKLWSIGYRIDDESSIRLPEFHLHAKHQHLVFDD